MLQPDAAPAASTACALALHGFEHVGRYWDGPHSVCAVRVLPGEFYVSREDEMITTVLGSCVAACVRDPVAGIGGMNHFLLPSPGSAAMLSGPTTRFGVTAMQALVASVLQQGGQRERLEFKLFGGGKVIEGMSSQDIGNRNIAFAQRFLAEAGCVAQTTDLGGSWPRKVHYFPRSGRALVKRLPAVYSRAIQEREQQLVAQAASPDRATAAELL